MAVQDSTTLKGYFETGDRPSQDEFADLIDTIFGATNGVHTISVPAGAMISRTTNGAASATRELVTNDVMLETFDFDPSTDEFVQFSVPMPKSWNEDDVTAVFIWTAASGSGDVIWGIQGLAVGDGDPLDAAFGTAVLVTDTLLTADDEHHSTETAAVAIGGSPAENDRVIFQIYRDADNVGDTLAVDAELIAVKILFTTNAATDD